MVGSGRTRSARRVVALVSVLVAVVLVLPACSSDSGARGEAAAETSTTVATHPAPPPGGSIAWLELESTAVAAGATIRGTVVVVNDTGSPIELLCMGTPYDTGIETPYGVQFMSRTLACPGPGTIPVGESRWPVLALARYDRCSDQPSTSRPPCQPDRTPPVIPGGLTHIVVVRSQLVPASVPVPAPVEITVE